MATQSINIRVDVLKSRCCSVRNASSGQAHLIDGVSMNRKLSSIVCTGPDNYTVQLDEPGSDRKLTFQFHVDDSKGIRVVQLSDEFWQYINHSFEVDYRSLTKTIARFHEARQIDFP